MTVFLPQDRAALIDRDLRVTLPYRRWMNDVTKAVNDAQAGTVTETAAPLEVTFTGGSWINVTGSIETGNINITLRDGITTDDLPEGVANLYYGYTVESVTASYTEDATNGEKFVKADATAGAITVTLPTAVGNTAKLHFKKMDASGNAVTLDGDGAETIDGAATAAITAQYTTLTIVSDGNNWLIQ